MRSNAWFLAGATATGKSAVAQILAEQTGGAILSADAMLVYKGMDVGTAKPPPETRRGGPYYGIDLVTPPEPFSAGRWLAAAAHAL
ncbi:MAG: tRNA (adenosine(37)-N6)-dimethylallyltransferase MiaA, partial [Kiritimatiellaeota bacterium]|nr:tRNA (adenosine(37)-N6)-dimethylallyltransferase MiaA [Kiritimatiellota bacterium]